MECNRDEAQRAKELAEGKIQKKDYAGAKKFALKAKSLYPGLDGVTQILTTVDVHISAENKISGEIDWYGVLGVNPSADDETIRKQYRKLALMLHPDKNKSIGADDAFKLISEAWGLLSDKAKRLAYNQRRGSKGPQQKVQMHTAGPSAPSRANGIFNFATKTTTSVPKTQNNVGKPKPPPAPTPTPSNRRSDTFWTICLRCKMHYEYLKMYLNHTLLCPNCREAFMATETPPPVNYSKSANQVPRQQHHTSSNHVPPSRNAHDPVRNAPVGQKSGLGSNSFRYQDLRSGKANVATTDPSIAAKAANVVQQAQDNVKRAYNESYASSGWEGSVKKSKLDDNSSQYGMNYNSAQGNCSFAPGSRIYGFSGINRRPNSTRDLTVTELHNMLIAKGKKEVLNTLRSSETTTKTVDKEKDTTKGSKKEKRQKNTADNGGHFQNGNNHSADQNASKEDPTAASMSVPDPDFHDFDEDRAESSFGDNEVWAAYDDDDGMPRFYALISKVISKSPFKLRISWLNSKTTTEFGSTMEWVGLGFYKTCGEFRVGRYETCKSINSFSQKINWSKGPRGSILILPQKGDVWAIYRNWSSDWNEHTPDEIIHKYEMVTVLDDYNEETGVNVAPLGKVVGFKTVFRPNLETGAVKNISKNEMFRFSHRVPYHLLTGLEDEKAPKGCLELDPAATPLDLLQVITEDNANADEKVLPSVT